MSTSPLLHFAETLHREWVRLKESKGWVLGSTFDAEKKTCPRMLPFEELPEGVRSKLLSTAESLIEELHQATAGCNPEEIGEGTLRARSFDEAARRHDLLSSKNTDLSALLGIWFSRTPSEWADDIISYRLLGERLLKLGSPLLAYDVLAEGLEQYPNDRALRRLQALSLARSGAPERAEIILNKLCEEGSVDEETLGLKARTHKDLWQGSRNTSEGRRQLQLAFEAYSKAYTLTGGYWTGINVATTAVILGKKQAAHEVARKVESQCLESLDREQGDPYWPMATLGEAALIQGHLEKAERWYREAVSAASGRIGDISSTRRNALLLIDAIGIDRVRFESCFNIPRVVVFSGHMIDRPDRPEPRFPASLEAAVQREIDNVIERIGDCVGYASAACGSDILFLEALLRRGREIHIVLPSEPDLFIPDSVDFIPGSDWKQRFYRVLDRASEVVVAAKEQLPGTPVSYEYTNLLLHGLARLRAEQLDTSYYFLTAWDGKAGDGPGGTASMVSQWQRSGGKVEIIDMQELLRRESSNGPPASPGIVQTQGASTTRPASSEGLSTGIRALLFADVMHFSKLPEPEIPIFVQEFLGSVARIMRETRYVPESRNTWGDGLYFAFDSVRAAGCFALELQEMVTSTNWRQRGMSADLVLRIGLHVGPVFRCEDPVTERMTCFGFHVSRTARIEPVTPPGKVYASQPFAAVSAIEPNTGFRCDYVGQTPLAKGFGTFPTYHVRKV